MTKTQTRQADRSVVDLDFVVTIKDSSYEDMVIMRVEQFTVYLSIVSDLLNEADVTKSERQKINKLLEKVQLLLAEVDQKTARINREFAKTASKELTWIRNKTSLLRSDRRLLRSNSARAAIKQLDTTVNTIKAFCDNCFKCNFM